MVTFGPPEVDATGFGDTFVPVYIDGERIDADILRNDTTDDDEPAGWYTFPEAPLGGAAGKEWSNLADAMRDVAQGLNCRNCGEAYVEPGYLVCRTCNGRRFRLILDMVSGINSQGDSFLAAVAVAVDDPTKSHALTSRSQSTASDLLEIGRRQAIEIGLTLVD